MELPAYYYILGLYIENKCQFITYTSTYFQKFLFYFSFLFNFACIDNYVYNLINKTSFLICIYHLRYRVSKNWRYFRRSFHGR